MKKIYSLLAVAFMFTGAFAQKTFTEWTFENKATTPTTGQGTLSSVGGVSILTDYQPGNGSATAIGTTNYPAKNGANRTSGIMAQVSTVGYYTIAVTYDIKVDANASEFWQFEYSTDGGQTWSISGNVFKVDTPNVFTTRTEVLTSVVDNNANFAFRVLAVHNPEANNGQYSADGNYSSTGVAIFDNIRVTYGTTTLGVKDVSAALAKVLIKNSVVDQTLLFGTRSDVKIYNVNGQVVKSASVKEGTALDLSSLPKGIYIVTGEVSGNRVSAKIIKR